MGFSQSDEYFSWALNDGHVYIMRLPGGKVVQVKKLGGGEVTFAPSSQTLASSTGRHAYLWQVDGTVLQTLVESTDHSVGEIAFSPEGDLIAMAGNQWRSRSGDEYLPSTLVIWKATDGTVLHRLNHDFAVEDIDFSPGGELLASVDSFGSIRIWRLSDGALLRTVDGLGTRLNRVSFSQDGILVMSVGSDDSLGTLVRLCGITSPTSGPPPTATPTRTPISPWEVLPAPPIYDDFSGEALVSNLWREASWAYPSEAGPTSNLSHELADGHLILRAQPVSYLTNLELDTIAREERTINRVTVFEARIYLPRGDSRQYATAYIKLKASFSDFRWFTQCSLGGLYGYPQFSCYVLNAKRYHSEHSTEERPILYDQWYVVRIEMDPSSGALQFYLDGELVELYVPSEAEQLRQAVFSPPVGIQSPINGGSFVAWVDDVRITE